MNAGMFDADEIADVAMSMEMSADLIDRYGHVSDERLKRQLLRWSDRLYGAQLHGRVERTPEEQSERLRRLRIGFDENRLAQNRIKRAREARKGTHGK